MDEAPSSLPVAPACPFCDSANTELVSPFGGHLSVAQYWCRSCRTAFDFLKWDAPEARDVRNPTIPPSGRLGKKSADRQSTGGA